MCNLNFYIKFKYWKIGIIFIIVSNDENVNNHVNHLDEGEEAFK